MKPTIEHLKKEKKRLSELAAKQEAKERKRIAAYEERETIKAEIRELKYETSITPFGEWIHTFEFNTTMKFMGLLFLGGLTIYALRFFINYLRGINLLEDIAFTAIIFLIVWIVSSDN